MWYFKVSKSVTENGVMEGVIFCSRCKYYKRPIHSAVILFQYHNYILTNYIIYKRYHKRYHIIIVVNRNTSVYYKSHFTHYEQLEQYCSNVLLLLFYNDSRK